MNKQHMATYINALENRIKELEADRPLGEWKPLDRTWGRETWYCTNCEDSVVDMPTYMGIALYKYCPNCGVRMRGADDE